MTQDKTFRYTRTNKIKSSRFNHSYLQTEFGFSGKMEPNHWQLLLYHINLEFGSSVLKAFSKFKNISQVKVISFSCFLISSVRCIMLQKWSISVRNHIENKKSDYKIYEDNYT